MKFYAFVILSVFAYSQAQAGPVNVPENAAEISAPAPINDAKFDEKNENHVADEKNEDDEDNDADNMNYFEEQPSSQNERETTTSNTSHLFNSTPESSTPSATPNLDAFMRAFEAIDPNVYSEIENFLENIVPKLPENNNPITNHLESAVFLFELYEKMKEPRELTNSQEENHFLSEIENFLASNSFLLFNKPTAGRQDLEDELTADQEGDEQNPEFELNDELLDNNLEDDETPEKSQEDENDEKKIESQQANKTTAA